MADISQVKLPDGTIYNLKDSYVRTNYRALSNNDFDTINVTELNAGDAIFTGAVRFTNKVFGDNNTTYSLSASGESVVLSGSDNSSSTANLSTAFANYTPYKGNLTSIIGSASPASAMKTYWENNDNIKPTSVNTAYNTAGQEYAFLLSKGGSNQYGAVIRWGYGTKYFEILRKYGSTWKDNDWVKMDAGYADSAGSATSATTASKLGSSNVGSATQPIYLSAGTATACTYTLGKSVPSDAVFTDHYAWTDITGKPSTFPPSTHYHSLIKTEGDNRSTATTPNDYVDNLIFRGLKNASIIGSPGGGSGYSYLVGLRGWGDSSGGDAHELAFNNNGVYYRHGATTTWGDWVKIFTSADTYTGTLTSSQVTTALGFTPTANTGTITSVKTTAGAHTTINVTSGAANFNVPTKTSHLTNDSGFVTTDTKNTAGSTDTSSKIFLIGATSQAANPQTYSQDTAYVGTDGCLYSGGSKVLTAHQDISGKVSKSGDTMTGCLSITSANSSWAEGIRINRGNGGYCSFVMGGAANSTSGTGDNVWWLGCNPSAYSHKWFVAHNGSTQTGTYFYVDSASQQSPHFRVGGDLAVGSSTTMSKTCTLRYNDSTLSMDFIFTT